MNPRIVNTPAKNLIGMRKKMSLVHFTIAELWQNFSPRIPEINGRLNHDLISMAIYEPKHFEDFKPSNTFERWAAVEVSNLTEVPNEMESYCIPPGMYAVFDYKGLNTNTSIFQYIFATWLPKSAYSLDNRPHFEVLGAKYKNNDPNSEEEIWIPIQEK